MPFEVSLTSPILDGTISATVHEHAGSPPTTIIRADQSWAVNVSWTNTGSGTGMITGFYDLHVFLERMGPGIDLDLTDPDPGEHLIPLTPGPSPVNYFVHFDVAAGAVPGIPDHGGAIFKVIVALTYLEPSGNRGPVAAHVESDLIQIYNPKASLSFA